MGIINLPPSASYCLGPVHFLPRASSSPSNACREEFEVSFEARLGMVPGPQKPERSV